MSELQALLNIVVVFLADKGGVGKTTNALNMLRRVMKDEKSVVLIDCDSKQYSSAKIAARRKANGIKPDLNILSMSSKDLEKNILEISKQYKIIIIEFGKAIEEMEREERTRAVKLAAKIADRIIMPIQPTVLDSDTIADVENKLISLNVSIPALIVPSRVMSKKQLRFFLAAEPSLKYFKFSKAAIYNRICYQEVHDEGRTIFDIKKTVVKSVKAAILESEQIYKEIFYE